MQLRGPESALTKAQDLSHLKAEKPTPILLHSVPSSVTIVVSTSIHSSGRSCVMSDRLGISSSCDVSTGNCRNGARSPTSDADTRLSGEMPLTRLGESLMEPNAVCWELLSTVTLVALIFTVIAKSSTAS